MFSGKIQLRRLGLRNDKLVTKVDIAGGVAGLSRSDRLVVVSLNLVTQSVESVVDHGLGRLLVVSTQIIKTIGLNVERSTIFGLGILGQGVMVTVRAATSTLAEKPLVLLEPSSTSTSTLAVDFRTRYFAVPLVFRAAAMFLK